jgi:transcriptional regulator GlxA family with amidase domain
MKHLKIAILKYPGSLQSALYGMQELFLLASDICRQQELLIRFEPNIVDTEKINDESTGYGLLIIPPSLKDQYYSKPDPVLISSIVTQYNQGCTLASACAGAFILAATGLLDHRTCTTHWELGPIFENQFPKVNLKTDDLLINHRDSGRRNGLD